MSGKDSLERVPILLVEDDPDDEFLIEEAFRAAAPVVRLHVVSDGEAAQDYLSGKGVYGDRTIHPFPALVLLDINLPKRTGLEVLEWMKQRPDLARVPVIILSSSTLESEVERAYALKANAYLSKEGPIDALDRMAAGVAALLEALRDEAPQADQSRDGGSDPQTHARTRAAGAAGLATRPPGPVPSDAPEPEGAA